MALSKCGIEVYITESLEEESEENKNDSSNSISNIKNNAKLQSKVKELTQKVNGISTDTEDSEETQEEESTPSFNSDLPFMLQNGATNHIDYIGEVYSESYEFDYTEMTSNVSLSIPNTYLELFFKGKKSCFKKGVQDGTLKWDDMKNVVLGFVTELTWNNWKIDAKISGMDKLLDRQETFDISQTKRSEVIKQIIEASGLKAKVDVTGLVDDVIDFKTSSSSDSGSGDTPGIGNAKIDDLVTKWCQGKTSDLEKAKAIHAGLRDEVGIWYAYYYNSRYHTPEKCLENHKHLNCGDTAILTTACMKSGGLNAYIVLRCDSAHYFTVIEIGGTKYYSDLTWSEGQRSQRAFNDTWENNKCGNKYDLK